MYVLYRPYKLPTIPTNAPPKSLPPGMPATYTDGQPYTFTILCWDQGYHIRFHECFIVYRIKHNGFEYQTKWEMIGCKKELWDSNGGLPKSIYVTVLARNPIPFEPGCLVGFLLRLLPRELRAKAIRRLRGQWTDDRGGFGTGGGSGSGTVYGSNDQDGSDDSSSSSPSGNLDDLRHRGSSSRYSPTTAGGSAPGTSSLAATSASSAGSPRNLTTSSSSSSSSSSSHWPRHFHRHHEVETWFVTDDSGNADQSYTIPEA